ncbi:MAG TPA: winged helix-turn-helix transcriptional regulator [Balneolaceae bacterium]|nr:winged helix-turn-helix transcriptional regulator [Balneolaceae bacterium]
MFTGSKKTLLDFIKRKGKASVDDTAEHTGLSKTTMREHLLQLERDGYIERDYLRTGPGRPSLQYQLTNKGNTLYPSGEAALLKDLLNYLKKKDDEETLQDFFEKFWQKRIKKARERMDDSSKDDIEKRMQAFAKMLEEEGFMPEVKLDENEQNLTVKECNCPFSDVVKETRLPCKLEAMFFKKLFGEAERVTHIAEGDYSCTYNIPINN